MTAQMENDLFCAVVQGLIHEDRELRSLFTQNGDKYRKQHNGVTCLYETTMVYITMKQLLRTNFPLTVSWEHPYPDRPEWKADLGLLNDDQTINSFVEFKIWLSEDGHEILGDIQKFKQSSFNGGRYLCVVELMGGDIESNRKFLDDMPGVHVEYYEGFQTGAYSLQKQKVDGAWVNIYLLKVVD